MEIAHKVKPFISFHGKLFYLKKKKKEEESKKERQIKRAWYFIL